MGIENFRWMRLKVSGHPKILLNLMGIRYFYRAAVSGALQISPQDSCSISPVQLRPLLRSLCSHSTWNEVMVEVVSRDG